MEKGNNLAEMNECYFYKKHFLTGLFPKRFFKKHFLEGLRILLASCIEVICFHYLSRSEVDLPHIKLRKLDSCMNQKRFV